MRLPQRRRVTQLGLLLALLGVWQALSSLGVLDPEIASSPAAVASAWWRWFTSGDLVRDCATSLGRVGLGMLLATGVAVPLALAAGAIPALDRQLAPVVELLRPIPPIAWVPLALLWFGIGVRAAAAVVFVGAFFPIFTAVYTGVVEVDASKVNAARSLGAGRRQVMMEIHARAALPSLFLGLRVGVGMAWMSVIAAELVGVRSGLGYRIQLAQTLLQTDLVIAGMLTIGAVGLCMVAALGAVERLTIPWHTRPRRELRTA